MCPIECSPNRLQHILHTPNTETCTMRRLVRVLFFPRPALLFSLYLSSLISRAGGGRWSARRLHERDETRSQTTMLRGEPTASRKIGFVRLRRPWSSGPGERMLLGGVVRCNGSHNEATLALRQLLACYSHSVGKGRRGRRICSLLIMFQLKGPFHDFCDMIHLDNDHI